MKLEQLKNFKSVGDDYYSSLHYIMELELEYNCESDFNFSKIYNQFKINK